MSSGLMSCVRENSPPLELDANESGALSLPETTMTAATSTSLAPMSPGAMSANCETAAPTAEQQKRRRFHPLRNLRRIFRRRTITSVDDSPAAAAVRSQNEPSSIGSTSEKNLRSATLSSISSVVSSPASSPSSPLAHQLLQSLHNPSCKSLPKSKDIKNSHGNMLLAPKAMQQLHQQQLQQQIQNQKQLQTDAEVMYASGASGITATTYHQRQQHVYNMSTVTSHSSANSALLTASSELQPMATTSGHRSSTIGGVAVLPGAFNAALSRSFFAERQKLKSLGDSSQELDSSANSSLGSSSRRVIAGNERNAGHASVNGSGGEMTDSQRSFSEGRLVDSDYSRDGLSQSHDSVFSESATASSLSIVLKAELADALRKRRNRPDASDEDLGLPRSPASPQRRSERSNAAANTTTPTTAGNQSDVSSLSMLSMNSNEGDSMFAETAANAVLHERNYMQVTASRYSRNSTLTSLSSSSDILRSSSTLTKSDTFGEVDLFSSDWQRLSHSAAKHKMAVRPTKKKGPSRQHRRTLETSIPEANEDLFKIGGSHLLDLTEKDAKNKTHSLPPGVNAKKLEQHAEHIFTPMIEVTAEASNSNTKVFDSARANDNKRSKMDNNKADSSEKPSASASSTSFGIRALTAKASSIFELKSESQQSEEREKTEDSKKSSQSAQLLETSESGFLRRLIQRNSKRTIPKATNGEDNADSQSEPKKLQISSSAYDTRESLLSPRLGQSQSAIAYDQQVEQTRKEIKREILSEAGLGAMLNTYLFTNNNDIESPRKSGSLAKDAADALHKPKSGPAARQRYLPQEIPSSSAVDKSKPVALAKLPLLDVVGSNSGGILSKSSHEESFQSTSIIREITASQSLAATKSEHHLFEKKPKIIGLSAFQQKISRANENSSRSQSQSSSSNSLEVKGEACFLSYEQKQRKSVEKSRSFRTYNSDKNSPTTNVHNNMPSLPDLSLHLPTFNEFILNEKEYSSPSPPERNDKCVSLGFEINDNNLVRPAIRTESANSLNRATSKLSAPTTAILPSLSPTNSCSNDMSEIEQNIDKIVKSPYVNVMRKSATVNEEMCSKTTSAGTRKLGEAITRGEMRPNSALLVKETKANEPKVSPSKVQLAVVPMRERTIACILEKPSADMLTRETERKSIGISNPATASKSNASSRPRRSSSVVESSNPETGTDTSVPEFLKIQLNRVDPGARALKSTVVLAKNVKETPVVVKDTSERSVSSDDLSLRRYSNESLEIVEHDKPVSPITSEKPVACLFEAINKQTKSLSTNSIQRATTNSELPPKTITIKKHPAAPTTQTPPIQTPPTLLSTANANTAGNSSTPTTPTEDVVTLRHKSTLAVEATATTTTTTTTTASSKLSLQERKRLFMNEEKSKADKKIEDLKNERKKSISEELQRKSSSSKTDLKESTAEEPIEKEPVIMRKKSFGVVQQTNALNAATNSNNTNSSAMTNTNCNGSSTTSNREDATPELMKVFARRSLKIKDEDLVHLADKILPATASSTALKKSTAGQSNVDSDKENQSASEEKLDKITKFETIGHSPMEQMNSKVLISNAASSISIGSTSITSTRSSLTDFRASATSFKNGGSTKALALNCNNNNNNNSSNSNSSNHTNNNNVSNTTTPTSKSSLPSLRVNSGLRTMTVNEQRSVSECMSNNNINSSNNHNNSQNSFNSQTKTSVERQSLCIRTTNVTDSGSKTIERSATVGEFKGILQRRAEWEQRAKEALK